MAERIVAIIASNNATGQTRFQSDTTTDGTSRTSSQKCNKSDLTVRLADDCASALEQAAAITALAVSACRPAFRIWCYEL